MQRKPNRTEVEGTFAGFDPSDDESGRSGADGRIGRSAPSVAGACRVTLSSWWLKRRRNEKNTYGYRGGRSREARER